MTPSTRTLSTYGLITPLQQYFLGYISSSRAPVAYNEGVEAAQLRASGAGLMHGSLAC